MSQIAIHQLFLAHMQSKHFMFMSSASSLKIPHPILFFFFLCFWPSTLKNHTYLSMHVLRYLLDSWMTKHIYTDQLSKVNREHSCQAFTGNVQQYMRNEQIELYLMENKGNRSNRLYYTPKDCSLMSFFYMYVFVYQKSRVISFVWPWDRQQWDSQSDSHIYKYTLNVNYKS